MTLFSKLRRPGAPQEEGQLISTSSLCVDSMDGTFPLALFRRNGFYFQRDLEDDLILLGI